LAGKTTAVNVAFFGAATIQNITAGRQQLLSALAESDEVVVDCGAVEDVDVCFLQMLVAAHLGARQAGKVVRLAAAPAGRLFDALERGGFLDGGDAEALFGRRKVLGR
jgi:anti-anti-sigma regulatory factor